MHKKITSVPSTSTVTGLVMVLSVAVAGVLMTNSAQRLTPFSENEEEEREQLAAFSEQRWLREFKMLRDPVLGYIPQGVREKELAQAFAIPNKFTEISMSETGTANQNDYAAAGPNNIGGRTRMMAFDKRNNNVIIAGC